jgi:hypothetical protein
VVAGGGGDGGGGMAGDEVVRCDDDDGRDEREMGESGSVVCGISVLRRRWSIEFGLECFSVG